MVLSWVIRGRYEVKSTVIISNRPLEEWGELTGDVLTATATLPAPVLAPGSNRNAVNKLDDDETPPLRLVSAAG